LKCLKIDLNVFVFSILSQRFQVSHHSEGSSVHRATFNFNLYHTVITFNVWYDYVN